MGRSRPVRARGLKRQRVVLPRVPCVAPRAGAWIETHTPQCGRLRWLSRPVRARGLKLAVLVAALGCLLSRPVRARCLRTTTRVEAHFPPNYLFTPSAKAVRSREPAGMCSIRHAWPYVLYQKATTSFQLLVSEAPNANLLSSLQIFRVPSRRKTLELRRRKS